MFTYNLIESGDIMDNKIDSFKNFIRDNTFLISYIRDGKKSWQDLFEVYDIYGDNKDAWDEYLKDNNSGNDASRSTNSSGNGTNYWGEFINMAKNIDVEKVQEGITSLQKTLSLFGDLFVNKENNSKTYNPRPLYRRFED